MGFGAEERPSWRTVLGRASQGLLRAGRRVEGPLGELGRWRVRHTAVVSVRLVVVSSDGAKPSATPGWSRWREFHERNHWRRWLFACGRWPDLAGSSTAVTMPSGGRSLVRATSGAGIARGCLGLRGSRFGGGEPRLWDARR